MLNVMCECCGQTYSDGVISNTQAFKCAASYYEKEGEKFIIAHYGSKYDTSKFYFNGEIENNFEEDDIICDTCIENLLEIGKITKDTDFNYFG